MKLDEPLINMPLEQFLIPVFEQYAKFKIMLSYNRVENGVLFINIEKRCKG